jgi:crotonobetainyl-CoA:carnitine CoA-transferase CaiB-like acyl-CoA transferase
MLLEGIKVIEWGDGLTVPFCGRLLADLGAEVIKIERPGSGDSMRREGPFWKDESLPNDSALVNYVNCGKRSITLDPQASTGAGLVRRLLRDAHILIESQAPGGLARAGLAVPELHRDNAALVVVSVSPFGQDTVLRDAAYSDLTLQHYSGFAHSQTRPVEDPSRQPPVGAADREGPLVVGISAASAALWGLLALQPGQTGAHIDLASLDFYAAHISPETLGEWNDGERVFDRYRHEFEGTEVAGGLVWILPCADGWVMVSPREQHQWERWSEVLGRPAWSTDAALCGDRVLRKIHYVRLREMMSAWSVTRTRSDIFASAQRSRVACFPVNTAADVLSNAQLSHRQFFNTLRSSTGQTIPIPGLSFDLTLSDGRRLPRAREISTLQLGEANDEIFHARLGLTAGEIERLRQQNIV